MRHIDQHNSHQEDSCGKQQQQEEAAMEDNGGSRVTGIRQIVKLKEFIQKWQTVTLGSKEQEDMQQHSGQGHSGISAAISRRLRGSNVYCDSDEDSCASPEPPHGVPKGYLAVYVGPELRRFTIPTSYLSDPLFKVLLEKVEEEFGFDHCGGLTIPCEIETFKYLLNCMETHQREKLNSNEDTDPEGTSPHVEE